MYPSPVSPPKPDWHWRRDRRQARPPVGEPPLCPPAPSRAWRGAALLLGLLWLAPVAGCDPPAPQAPNALRYSEDARKAYEKALEAFLDRDWEEARLQMQEVRRKYAYSRYARLAEQRLADMDFEQEKYAAAITGYRGYINDHPADEGVPYARFRICKALYAQISDTVLLPPQEERDQAAIVDAFRELSSFMSEYPRSKWSTEAQFMLVTVTGRLVRHELYVARYYLRRDNFEAATRRIQYALDRYDGSGLEPEALVLLAETYAKMKKPIWPRPSCVACSNFTPPAPLSCPPATCWCSSARRPRRPPRRSDRCPSIRRPPARPRRLRPPAPPSPRRPRLRCFDPALALTPGRAQARATRPQPSPF